MKNNKSSKFLMGKKIQKTSCKIIKKRVKIALKTQKAQQMPN